MSDIPEGGYREMDKIDLAGLNHVRHELEECSKTTKIDIDSIIAFYIAMSKEHISTAEATKRINNIFSKRS